MENLVAETKRIKFGNSEILVILEMEFWKINLRMVFKKMKFWKFKSFGILENLFEVNILKNGFGILKI